MRAQNPFQQVSDLPQQIPVFPLGGALLLPRGRLPLNIFEPRYLEMVDAALASHRLIGMVQPLEPASNDQEPALQAVGCVGRITSFEESGDQRYGIVLTGVTRFQIQEELPKTTPYRQVKVNYDAFSDDLHEAADGEAINRDRLTELLRQYLEANNLEADWESINNTKGETLVNSLCMISPFGMREKQALLEAKDCVTRADVLIALIEMAMAQTQAANDDDTPPLH